MEHCLHAQEWGEMKKTVHDLDKDMYGNGQKGLTQRVAELSEKIERMSDDIKDLCTNVSALVRFESEIKGVENYKDKSGIKIREKTSIIISAILGVSGLIITLIIKYG